MEGGRGGGPKILHQLANFSPLQYFLLKICFPICEQNPKNPRTYSWWRVTRGISIGKYLTLKEEMCPEF